MKFFDSKAAPSPQRVRMFIAEKGIEIETVEVDIFAGEQFTDDFRAMNPLCTVPVIALDDGTHLTTTDGCRAWLEATYPEPPLLGRTAEEKGQIGDALHVIMFYGQMAVSEALRNTLEGDGRSRHCRPRQLRTNPRTGRAGPPPRDPFPRPP